MKISKRLTEFKNEKGESVYYQALYLVFNPEERQHIFDIYGISINEVMIKSCRPKEGKFIKCLLDVENDKDL